MSEELKIAPPQSAPAKTTIQCSPWAKSVIEMSQEEFDSDTNVKSVDMFVSFCRQLEPVSITTPEQAQKEIVAPMVASMQRLALFGTAHLYKTTNIHVQRQLTLFLNDLENAHAHLKKAIALNLKNQQQQFIVPTQPPQLPQPQP